MTSGTEDTTRQTGIHPDNSCDSLYKARIPEELRTRPQWVCWRYGPLRPNGKRSKDPIDSNTGTNAKVNDPKTWGSYGEAVAAVERYGAEGIGFVLTKDDPFAGGDLDGCIKDGEIAPWAAKIVERANSYAEISPSGTGIKFFVLGSLPTHKTGVRRGPVELYQHGRFFTVTGEALETGKSITEAQDTLDALYERIEAGRGEATTRTTRGLGGGAGFTGEDEALLEKAARKPLFRALYYGGDHSGFTSQSDADLYLCSSLAFWTGKDAGRMDRLFRGSALYREKWEREDYRRGTIDLAIKRCRNVYTGRPPGDGREHARESFLKELEAVERIPFNYRGGDTDYKLSHAFINTGCVSGSISGDYPTVALSERDMQAEAGIGSRGTVQRSLERLEHERGYIEQIHPGGKHTAATYRLRFSGASLSPQASPNPVHKGDTTTVSIMDRVGRHPNVTKWRAPYTPPRKAYDKNGRPVPSYTGHPEKRLRPRSAQIDRFVVSRGSASLHEIADRLGITDRRTRHKLKAKGGPVADLVNFGFLEEREGRYYPVSGHEERHAEYLEQSGCNEAEQRQRDRIERERLAYGLHDVEERVVQDYEQPGYDPDEHVPDPEPPEPDNAIPATGARPDFEPDSCLHHPLDCECEGCIYPEPKYATPYRYTASATAGSQESSMQAEKAWTRTTPNPKAFLDVIASHPEDHEGWRAVPLA